MSAAFGELLALAGSRTRTATWQCLESLADQADADVFVHLDPERFGQDLWFVNGVQKPGHGRVVERSKDPLPDDADG